MTPATAAAMVEATRHLYECFGGYHDRLSKQPRAPEDQAIFAQLFAQDVRQLRPEMLLRLVTLLRLPKHHYGTLELKHLLPRLCEISLEDRPAIDFSTVAELLGRFNFDSWPTVERTAVWDYLLLRLRGLLEEFSERKAPPWGAYGYFRDLCHATEQVQPALLSWEMTDFVTADLHLAAFATTWVEDRPLRDRQLFRSEQMEVISRWLYSTGREKLTRAARTYADSPFRAELESALESLRARPTPKSFPPHARRSEADSDSDSDDEEPS